MSDETLAKLKALRDARAENLLEVEVGELDEVWYYSPEISMRDFRRLMAAEDRFDRAVMMVQLCALSAKGRRIFDDAHKGDVEQMPVPMVSRIAGEIWDHLNLPDVEAAKKK